MRRLTTNALHSFSRFWQNPPNHPFIPLSINITYTPLRYIPFALRQLLT